MPGRPFSEPSTWRITRTVRLREKHGIGIGPCFAIISIAGIDAVEFEKHVLLRIKKRESSGESVGWFDAGAISGGAGLIRAEDILRPKSARRRCSELPPEDFELVKEKSGTSAALASCCLLSLTSSFLL